MKHTLLIRNYSLNLTVFGLILALFSCSQPETISRRGRLLNSDGATTTENKSNAASGLGLSGKGIKRNPSEARATIVPQVNIGPSDIIPAIEVPTLQIQRTDCDYVQIIRCPQSYKLETQLGDEAKSLGNSVSDLQQKGWAWAQAINDNRRCKVVNLKAANLTFPDLTADTGTMYYVINPCFFKEQSKSKKDECSFDLTFTEPFTYKEALRKEIRDQALRLSEREGEIYALITRLQGLTDLLVVKLTACENMVATDIAITKAKTGMVMFGSFMAGGAIGMTMGGPNAAVTAAQLSMAFVGGMWLVPKLKLFPPQNSCLNGAYKLEDLLPPEHATMEDPEAKKQMEEDAAKTLDMLKDNSEKYERTFGVKEILDEMDELVDPNGIIAEAKSNLMQEMENMQKIDSRTMMIDQAYQQLGNVDLSPEGVTPETILQLQPEIEGAGAGAGAEGVAPEAAEAAPPLEE